MADSSTTAVPSPAAPGTIPMKIPHTRLSFLTKLFGDYGDQEPFFSAVNNGDVRRRAGLQGTEGVRSLRAWMEECRVELVSLFSSYY